ncbi:hypothetical protein BDA99DRAFT_345703 [Phascolomyces articulosus]|uniref:Uncharacterized protein n=1 Tax=Phascolomyces articulosus TaxID=60185 RepID=A0AAD5K4Y1_9FUNG|nr:hypothetical protein BDA99DRAFT_345703 [Phascolomyces articulosus]
MSKWILMNPEIINIIVKTVVGLEAFDQYLPGRTEWKPAKRSYAVYTTNKSKALPPIIIKVQNTVEERFICRLNEYCLNATTEFHKKPVVFVFSIKSTNKEVVSNTRASKVHPFMLCIPSYPWVIDCLLLSDNTIQQFTQEKHLHPMVALTSFLTKQKQPLRECPNNDDPTIRMLYRITMTIYEIQGSTLNRLSNDFHCVCDESMTYMNEVVEVSKNDGIDDLLRKRAMDCLEEGTKVQALNFALISCSCNNIDTISGTIPRSVMQFIEK